MTEGISNRARGTMGEVRAQQYLVSLGWQMLDHNAAGVGGEIDLIGLDGNVLVFVEVKLRNHSAILGREAVTPAKQKRICRAALFYMQRNRLMNHQARFDVIEIQDGHLTHIRNAFPYCGPVY